MTKAELVEKIRLMHEDYVRLEAKHRQLRRRVHVHRGEITREQAHLIRTHLRGHVIDAAHVVDFEPSEYVLPGGDVDLGRLIWWVHTVQGKWIG